MTYIDRWYWDGKRYSTKLTAVLRSPLDGFPLAVAHSTHAASPRKPPAEMTDEVVDIIAAAKS